MDSRLSPNLLDRLGVRIYPELTQGKDTPNLWIENTSSIEEPFMKYVVDLTKYIGA